MARVELEHEGATLSGWTSVRVSAGVERAAADFSLVVGGSREAWRGRLPVRVGGTCRVLVDGVAVLTGYVDAVRPRYDATSASVEVSGRSRTSDAVDSQVPPGTGPWSGLRLLDLAGAIAAPFGVEVAAGAGVDATSIVPRFRAERAEGAVEAIERLVRHRGLLVTDDGAGRLVLWRPQASAPVVATLGPAAFLDAQAEADASERFSEYLCRGQIAGTNVQATAESTALQGHDLVRAADAVDFGVRRRVLVVVTERALDSEACRLRAEWEASHRAAVSVRVAGTVQSWIAPRSGLPWAPGDAVEIDDPLLGVSGRFVVAERDLVLGADGEIVRLGLVPPAAYEPEAAYRPSLAGGSGGSRYWAELEDFAKRPVVGAAP